MSTLVVSIWGLTPAPASAAPEGVTISGKVVATSANSDPAALEGISVDFLIGADRLISAVTDATGAYTISVPYSPRVRLVASMHSPLSSDVFQYVQEKAGFNQIEKSANGIWFSGEPIISIVNVSPNDSAIADQQIEFPLAAGYGKISGQTKNESGDPLKVMPAGLAGYTPQEAVVNVYDSDGTLLSQVQAKDGAYEVAEMPGTYYLSVGDSRLSVAKQFYGSVPELSQATPVSITAGAETTGIDFRAAELSFFQGSDLYAANDGTDAIVGRRIGVKVDSAAEPGSTLTIAWQNVTCPGDTSVVLIPSECTYVPIAGAVTTILSPPATATSSYLLKNSDVGSKIGVIATLTKPGFLTQTYQLVWLTVSGPIKVLSAPKISGLVKVGKTVKAVLPKLRGITPDSYDYFWLSCDSAKKAKTASCNSVSSDTTSNTSLKVPKSLKGKYLVLQVWSHNNANQTRIITISAGSKVK
jgi:hypothetical protein